MDFLGSSNRSAAVAAILVLHREIVFFDSNLIDLPTIVKYHTFPAHFYPKASSILDSMAHFGQYRPKDCYRVCSRTCLYSASRLSLLT